MSLRSKRFAARAVKPYSVEANRMRITLRGEVFPSFFSPTRPGPSEHADTRSCKSPAGPQTVRDTTDVPAFNLTHTHTRTHWFTPTTWGTHARLRVPPRINSVIYTQEDALDFLDRKSLRQIAFGTTVCPRRRRRSIIMSYGVRDLSTAFTVDISPATIPTSLRPSAETILSRSNGHLIGEERERKKTNKRR